MNVPPEYVIHGKYDPYKEAVRSIGVVIYQMLYGRAPYTNYDSFSDVIAGLPKFDYISEGKCSIKISVVKFCEKVECHMYRARSREAVDVALPFGILSFSRCTHRIYLLISPSCLSYR